MSNHSDTIAKALDSLKLGLGPYIRRELEAQFGNKWRVEVKNVLSGTKLATGKVDELGDVAAQLVVMDRLWGAMFRNVLGRADRALVNELIDVRNRWAHQQAFSAEDADRALDSIYRLLGAVGAPQADEMRKMREAHRTTLVAGSAPETRESSKRAQQRQRAPDGYAASDHRTRILGFITRFPGRDDDEIAAALGISPRQTVNQLCRMLCGEKLVRREKGVRGKLVNFAI